LTYWDRVSHRLYRPLKIGQLLPEVQEVHGWRIFAVQAESSEQPWCPRASMQENRGSSRHRTGVLTPNEQNCTLRVVSPRKSSITVP
jgi:hypothetical protein